MGKIRQVWHNVTHKHMEATKGEKRFYVCATRGPWGKAIVLYQPNEHIEPFPITPDQMKRAMRDEPLYVDVDAIKRTVDGD